MMSPRPCVLGYSLLCAIFTALVLPAQESALVKAEAALRGGRAAQALSALESFLPANPKSGAAWRLKGLAQESLGRDEAAVESLTRAYRLGRSDTDVVARLARAARAAENWAEAAEFTAQWSRTAPAERRVLRPVEAQLREQAGQLEAAMRLWREAFLDGTSPGPAASELGRLALQRGQLTLALTWLRLAAEFGEDETRGRRRRAAALAEVGRRDEAALLLETCLLADESRSGDTADTTAVEAARLELARFQVRSAREQEAVRILAPLFSGGAPPRAALALGARIAARTGEADRERRLWTAFFSAGGEDREGRRRLGRHLVLSKDWAAARPHLSLVASSPDADADDIALALQALIAAGEAKGGRDLLKRYVVRRGVDARARRLARDLRELRSR